MQNCFQAFGGMGWLKQVKLQWGIEMENTCNEAKDQGCGNEAWSTGVPIAQGRAMMINSRRGGEVQEYRG